MTNDGLWDSNPHFRPYLKMVEIGRSRTPTSRSKIPSVLLIHSVPILAMRTGIEPVSTRRQRASHANGFTHQCQVSPSCRTTLVGVTPFVPRKQSHLPGSNRVLLGFNQTLYQISSGGSVSFFEVELQPLNWPAQGLDHVTYYDARGSVCRRLTG